MALFFFKKLNGYIGRKLAIVALLSLGMTGLVACNDPMKQSIPTSSDKWQEKLADTLDDLPEEERQLLSRYMLRMKLSGVYDSGAMPRITVGNAIKQQREYERLHPNNPTGKQSPITANTNQQADSYSSLYPVTLLPVRTSNNDSLNNVKLQFILSNHGKVAIESFKGTLLLKAKTLKEGKRFDIDLTKFTPPIEPEYSGKIIIDSQIHDVNIMRAIKDSQAVTVDILQGELTLADGQVIEFNEQ